MTIRETMEAREYQVLSPFAAHSRESLGRVKDEVPCDIRTCYQRDRDRILHSKSFRRLKNKTQVFLAPEDDHYRTRMTHTLEVSQIARTIAKALSLNEDLVEAIALGHDLGHTPFGHSGEYVLDEVMRSLGEKGFEHAEQSVRIVETLENGTGLNLSREVVDGIRNHSMDDMPMTLEGKIVRIADKIAYINHDIDDAIRAGVLSEEMLPPEFTDVLGKTVKIRLDAMVHDVITNSTGINDIRQSEAVEKAMLGLRKYLYDELYTSPYIKREEGRAQEMLRTLFLYYYDHIAKIPADHRNFLERGERRAVVVCDYISGMTDHFAVREYSELFVPKTWRD